MSAYHLFDRVLITAPHPAWHMRLGEIVTVFIDTGNVQIRIDGTNWLVECAPTDFVVQPERPPMQPGTWGVVNRRKWRPS